MLAKKMQKNNYISIKYISAVVLLCVVSLSYIVRSFYNINTSGVRLEFDKQVVGLNVLVYYPSGKLLNPNKYKYTENDNCIVLNNLPEGVWWIALEPVVSNYSTSHIDAYKVVAKNGSVYKFQTPKDRVSVNLHSSVDNGFNKVWMKVQRYDGDLIDPVFRKWRYLHESQSLKDTYRTYMNINAGRRYLLTFYQSNDYIDRFIGSMSIVITDEHKDGTINIYLKHILEKKGSL